MADDDARIELPGDAEQQQTFIHITPKDTCDHDFKGWREFDDGNGGEQVCSKCGLGAMAYTLRNAP